MSDDVVLENGMKVGSDVLEPNAAAAINRQNETPAQGAQKESAPKKSTPRKPRKSTPKKQAAKEAPPAPPVVTLTLGERFTLCALNGTPAEIRKLRDELTKLAAVRAKGQKSGDVGKAIATVKSAFPTYDGSIPQLVANTPDVIVKGLEKSVQSAFATIKGASDITQARANEVHDTVKSIGAYLIPPTKVTSEGIVFGKKGRVRGNRGNTDATTSADFPSPFQVASMHLMNGAKVGKEIKPDFFSPITSPDGLVQFLTQYAWSQNWQGLKDKKPNGPGKRGIRGTLGSSTQRAPYWVEGQKGKVLDARLYGKVIRVKLVA